MEFDCCDSSKWYWRKHLEQNHHPSPRPMQDTKSLFFRSSQFILILAVVHAFPALAQTTPTTLGAGTSTGSTSQGATSPIPSNSPFLGGTPSGKATPDSLQLTLRDAIDRGLRYNLGLVLTGIASRSARAERLRTLSEMLPHLRGKASVTEEQINLAAFGFPVAPGTNPIIGPFSIWDARGIASDTFDLHLYKNYRAAAEQLQAAHLGEQNARELVVLVIADLYLEGLANQARVKSAQAQFATAETVYKQTVDLRNNGVAAGIDVLRAQVDMQARQQRLVAVENDFTKQKLTVGRAIGLPVGQRFEFSDAMPNPEVPQVTLEKALSDAYQNRFDYQQSQRLVHAAEQSRIAAGFQRLPGIRFDGDYGTIGQNPSTSHPTYTAALSVRVPVFEGGKIEADVQQANAVLAQRQAELEDLRGQIDQEVRTAFLDLDASSRQVQVAQSSVQLAGQQLQQARDRFAAGVAGSLEVVESEQAVAGADENLISSIYAYNLAKAALARATGLAEKSAKDLLGVR
jgi:outer membrane protein TolC